MSKHRKRPLVKIRNPHPGGATYTSLARARNMVDRDVAVFDGPGHIQLLPARWVNTLRQMEASRIDAAQVDAAIQDYRHGMVWWNGANRHGCSPPGLVRS